MHTHSLTFVHACSVCVRGLSDLVVVSQLTRQNQRVNNDFPGNMPIIINLQNMTEENRNSLRRKIGKMKSEMRKV